MHKIGVSSRAHLLRTNGMATVLLGGQRAISFIPVPTIATSDH